MEMQVMLSDIFRENVCKKYNFFNLEKCSINMNITKSNRVDMILGVRSQATVTFKDIF
jgi:hypothetical protein